MSKTGSLTNTTVRLGAEELRFRITAAETDGELVAVDVTMPPGGGPPMLHRHACTELYLVRGGAFAIYRQDAAGGTLERLEARAGDVVLLAAGVSHTVRNESAAPADAHVVFTPGDQMERFVRAAAGARSVDEVLALAARHGVEMTGPAPAPPQPNRPVPTTW